MVPVFREDLYPRIETSAVTVQKYAEDLDVLPPIEVNQHNELIDGWHRWTAHKKAKAETIPVKVTKTATEADFLELAIARNASHGLQLSQSDKRDMARKIYSSTPDKDRSEKKKRFVGFLQVCKIPTNLAHRIFVNILRFPDFLHAVAREPHFKNPLVACFLRILIHPAQPVRDGTVANRENLGELERAKAEHATDFKAPIYNIWKQQEKSKGSEHFGNSEITWLDNLLYLYTSPFDVVVDPFAGGGSTIDLCRKRLRRYWVSDRQPIPERVKQIRQHDVNDGLPKLPRWEDVRLVYLDPPYWVQAKGRYSKDKNDLANMSLEDFNKVLSGTITAFAKKLKPGAAIALIIQPTQWNAPNREFTDHVGDMLRAVKLPVDMRFSVPYESQQCNAQMVEWAQEHKRCLVLTREMVVWRTA